MAYSICFPEQHRVAVEEYDPGQPDPGQVRLRAIASQISNGTESILLGDTGTPGEQRLTGDVVMRGLRIVGAHDSHSSGAWSERRILDLFAGMVSQGRFDMTGLTTHVVPARRAAEAYAAIDRDPSGTMGVILDWQEI